MLEINVPSLCLRGAGPCAAGQIPAREQYRPFLNTFPIPNGPEIRSTCNPATEPNPPCDPVTRTRYGFARFSASYAYPSSYDATSIRVDHTVGKLNFFGRFATTPSTSSARSAQGLNYTTNSTQDNTTFTVGSTWLVSKSIVNDLRVNYTVNDGPATLEPDDFGGGLPLQTFGFLGRSPATAAINMILSDSPTSLNFVWGLNTGYKQRQFNVVDNLSVTTGDHQLKFGVDFRRSNPLILPGGGGAETMLFSVAQLFTGQVSLYASSVRDPAPHAAAFDNLSIYAQDTWKVNRRLTVSYGVRWELVPPPHATEGTDAITLDGLDSPLLAGNLSVAPIGTPLWETRYVNFAPRLGASFLLIGKPGRELVVRGGGGIFYDLGLGNSAEGFGLLWPNTVGISYPITGHPDPQCRAPLSFPLPACALVLPVLGSGFPTALFMMDREIELPRTYQWNFSAEQSLGAHQTVTVSYVGAAGRKLLAQSTVLGLRLRGISYTGSATTSLRLQRNLGYSDYDALQFQFQRRLHQGLQALVSYTFSHSKDTESADDAGVPIEAIRPETQYGYSSFDVRHNLTAAVTYQLPGFKGNSFLSAITRDWGVDTMFRNRTGFPINVTASGVVFSELPPPGTLSVRPNVVAGQPFWVNDPTAPGGRRLNTAAFSRPANGTVGDLPKGVVRGFAAKQIDMALHRDFPLSEHIKLQLRAEAFNVFNWPNFANPNGSITANGLSGSMLNRSLGGLSALYQIGGPRSMQFAARITF